VHATEAASPGWSALVLAAGAGERMGGLPKGLIRVDGEPLLSRLLAALRSAGARDIVVTLGHHADALRPLMSDYPEVRAVQLPEGAQQADSLRAGLAAVPARHDVLVCLADQPAIDAAALTALRSAWRHRPPGIDMLVPVVDDLPGNPVMLSAAAGAELRDAPGAETGKTWRQRNAERVLRWASDNSAFRIDLDTTADVDRLRTAGWRIDLPDRP